MIKRILVPSDGSPNSSVALDYAIFIANIFDAEITALNIIDVRALEGPFFSDISGALGFSPYQDYLPKFQGILEQRGDLILEEFKRYCKSKNFDRVKIKRMIGIVPSVIADEAKRVDLVVIAQRGEHEKWSTGLMGSTTESVVRKSPDPVFVTPNTFSEISKVVIAYDGGTEANKALKTACEFLTGFKSSIKIVFVTDDDIKSSKLTDEVQEFIEPYRLNIETVRLQGEPAKEILKYTENKNIDLIIMGAFGHSRLYDLILGGTTAYILRKSKIPVLLNR